MNRKKVYGFSLILMVTASVLAVIQIQCRHDGINADDIDKVCYEKDIAPIFQSCGAATGCHNQQSSEGGYVFTDYNSVMKAITPFNAQKSLAYKAITGKGFVQLMPPAGALSQKERILIRVWIDQGAENTLCTASGKSGAPVNKVRFQRDLLPVLVSSCGITGCHDQATHEEGYVVANYATVMSNLVYLDNGKLLASVKATSIQMPPGYKISACELREIELWRANGALQN